MSAYAVDRNNAIDVVNLSDVNSAKDILNGCVAFAFTWLIEDFKPDVLVCHLSGLDLRLEPRLLY